VEARRVLILCEQGLLWRGVQSLLEADPRLKIVAMTDNLPQACALLEELKPDVLIVDQAHFPLSLGRDPAGRVLDPPPLLVSLDESENWIRIHHIQGHALTGPGELIEALVK
jgi:DNA-binding NarL/FixJ family response regulator